MRPWLDTRPRPCGWRPTRSRSSPPHPGRRGDARTDLRGIPRCPAPTVPAPAPIAATPAAAAATVPAAITVPPPSPPPSSGSARAASYSPTDANTGMPADAASARADASGATMSSRVPLTIASRASSRKLIRDVATRDPNGTTSPTRVSAAARIRAAAEVISSSASR